MEEKVKQYLKKWLWDKQWRKVVLCMAAVVIFCTTYALVLPAITVENKEDVFLYEEVADVNEELPTEGGVEVIAEDGEEMPAEDGEEEAPAEDGEEEAPAEDGEEEAPAEEGGEEAPAEEGGEEAPAEEGGEEAPAEDGEEEAPAEEGGEEAPAEDGEEEIPAEEGREEAPVEEDGEETAKAYVHEVTTEVIVGMSVGQDVVLANEEILAKQMAAEKQTEQAGRDFSGTESQAAGAETEKVETPKLQGLETEATTKEASIPEDAVKISNYTYLTYRLHANIATVEENVSYAGDMLYFSVKLPYTEHYACFDTENLSHFVLWNVETDDEGNQILSGCYEIKAGEEGLDPIPGLVSFDIPMKVLGMKRGDILLPEGQCWIEENAEEYVKEIEFQKVAVDTEYLVLDMSAANNMLMNAAAGQANSYVDAAVVSIGYDGTAPFDSDTAEQFDSMGKVTVHDPGNDSREDNGIVRSFDSIGYNVLVVLKSTTTDTTVEATTVYVEVKLPYSKKEAVFGKITSLQNANIVEKIENGKTVQTLTGYYVMQPEGSDFDATQTLTLPVEVRAMPNGSKVTLSGKCWAENSANVVDLVFPEVTVSAKMDLNVAISMRSGGEESVIGKWDFTKGDVDYYSEYGAVYGKIHVLGITLQLRHTDISKGMKGQELPNENEDIKVTLDFSTGLTTLGKDIYTADSEKMKPFQPLVYSVDKNDTTLGQGQSDGRTLTTMEGRNTARNHAWQIAPICSSSGTPSQACENSGVWKVDSWEAGKVTLKVSGNKISEKFQFPYANWSYDYDSYYNRELFDKNQGFQGSYTDVSKIGTAVFSTGEIWIVQPYSYTKDNQSYNIYDLIKEVESSVSYKFTIKDGENIEATSISGTEISTQSYFDKDDKLSRGYELGIAGSYEQEIWYSTGAGLNVNLDAMGLQDALHTGRDYTVLGNDQLAVVCGYNYATGSDYDNNYQAASNILMKFDAEVFELDEAKTPEGIISLNTSDWKGETRIFYGYRSDGKTWSSEEEMQSAEEWDLIWKSNYDSQQTCVAILFEHRGIVTQAALKPRYFVRLKAKADPTLLDSDINNNVRIICEDTKLWTTGDVNVLENTEKSLEKIKSKVPSVGSGSVLKTDYPVAAYGDGEENTYTKTVYDNSGVAKDHNFEHLGDSILLLSYQSKIDKTVAQKTAENTTKEIFNINNDERIADFKITASIDYQYDLNVENVYSTTTVTIVDILPKKMNYQKESAYWNGTYQQSSDNAFGGTILNGKRFVEVDDITTTKEQYALQVEENSSDGTTKITFQIKNVDIRSGEIGHIYYSTKLGNEFNLDEDVENDEQLMNTATIQTTEDCLRPLKTEYGNKTQENIVISKMVSSSFNKVVVKRLNEVDENLSWKVYYNNATDVTQVVELMDTMPSVATGSKFSGGYEINEWVMNTAKATPDDFTLYYTTDSKYQTATLNAKTTNKLDPYSWDEVNTWEKLEISDDGAVEFPKGVTIVAWAIKGNLGKAQGLDITVTIKQDQPQGSNVLYNIASTTLFERKVPAYRVQRQISGNVWWDYDYDGQRETMSMETPGTEKDIEDVTVMLQKYNETSKTWEVANALLPNATNGRTECIMRTDENGYYSFNNLPAGEYRVMVGNKETNELGTGDEELDSSEVFLTDKMAAGVDDAVNSKADVTVGDDEGTAVAQITDIYFREAEYMSQWVDHLQYQNAGFCVVGYELPETGGEGTAGFILAGMALMFVPIAYTFCKRKKIYRA